MDLYKKLSGKWDQLMVRGFRSFHPFVLLVYYVFVITSLMLYQHPFFLLTAVFLLIGFNYLLDKGEQLKKWGWMIVIMCTFILILTPLFNRRGNHIEFYLFNNPIMLEAMIQGVVIALTLIGIIMIFVTFNMVITADKFLFLFSKWLPKWALLTMLAMRFVPLLKRRLQDIEQVQQSKGMSIKHGSIRQRARNGMLLMQILLTFSLEEAIQTADSMAARGYGLQKRSKYQAYAMQKRDTFALSFISVATVIIIFGWWLGDGVLMLLPILEPLWLYGREWFYFTIWLLLIGFPIWAEGKEVMKWKFYQQKV
ncbi:energy-coupling factor transporter transmembrane component T [Oceanobacillus halotolerans]|uniref:energy-coupling factor transporter transmembrane component T n=1 Tax=Oceanobacillus halotolerans TaxID=2663380 RepID=UPI001CF79FB4|nr:energy-coupling factor transporter transmembrane component T [Oceanobacillus halotolerans]